MGTEPFIRILEIQKILKFGLFLKIAACACAGVIVVQYMYSVPVQGFLNRLIRVRQTLLYKYVNLYLLKIVSLFTFHSLFYILSTRFSLYLDMRKINPEIRPTLGPKLPR